MKTIIEKVILLQEVDIFSEVPTELLAYLAAVAEEFDFEAGRVIFQEGDDADVMYQVVSGAVRLHRGDTEVTVARVGQPFGTWALFDDEQRVVSATAVEAGQALAIAREDFVDVLADNVQVTQAILRGMVRRLRGLGRIVRSPSSG